MNGKQLKNSILQWAIQGKLVPQDPNDEPASVLLEKIRQEKERLIKEKKIKRDKNASIIYRGEDNSYYEKMLATGEVKCIDEEIPFEIPVGWEWTRIGNIFWVTKLAGFEYTKFFTKDAITSTNAVPIVRAQNVRIGKFEENKNEAIPITLSNQLERSSLIKRCLLMTFIGAGIGDVCIFPAYRRNHLAPNVAKIEPFNNDCSLEFFLMALMSPLGQLGVNSIKKSTAQPSLSMETIRHILIPIPPLPEQERIVSKIGLVMPIIDKYSKSQELLDKMNVELNECLKKSVLQEAIQGKLVPQIAEEGTAQELLDQIKAEKQKLVKEGKLKKSALATSVIFRGDDNKYYELIDGNPVCIDEFLPFQIHETWVWCKVKDLLEIQTGASFKKEQANANKKGIRILRGGNILPNKYIFKDDDVFVSEEFVNANTILKKNCIITPAVTSLENIGKMAVIEKDYNNVSAGGFVFIISPYIQAFNHSLLLAYFLQSPFLIEAMRGITKKSGAAFYNLGKERLKELYLPLPPMAEQRRIVGKINEVLSSIMSR